MLKNLVKLVNLPRNCSSIFLAKPGYYFSSKTSIAAQSSYAELQQIAKLLGTVYYKHNDEVEYSGDLRLIDANNSLIGVYNLTEARRICEQKGLDLVMINPNVKPAICKALKYRDELYNRFVKDVISKDMTYESKAKAKTVKKTVKLGARMTISDLRNKMRAASELSKKTDVIRITMPVNPETADAGRNVMMTFADMSKEFLRPSSDIQMSEVKAEEEEEAKEGEEELMKLRLNQEFKVLKVFGEKDSKVEKIVTEQDLKTIIHRFLSKDVKSKGRRENITEMMKGTEKEGKIAGTVEVPGTKGGDNLADVDLGEADTIARAKEKRVLEGVPEQTDELKLEYMTPEHQKEMKEKLDNLQKMMSQRGQLTQALEEIREKFGAGNEEEMINYHMSVIEDRLSYYQKYSKIVELLNKKKRPPVF